MAQKTMALNNKKNNVLFVSLAFPPKNCPESLQTARYFKYLTPHIGQIQVVTAKAPSLFMPVDSSLMKFYPDNNNVVNLWMPESKYLNFIIRKTFPTLLELPDNKRHFSFFTNRIINRIKIEPDVIYSRSFPLTSAFIAYNLKKRLKKPWILHLSDPWTISPIEKRTAKSQNYNEKMESLFFSVADYITFTSEETIAQYKLKYPDLSSKFQFFPNVYDPEDIPAIDSEENKLTENIVFSYTGGLANTRTHANLLEALSQLYKSEPTLFINVSFNFAGSFDRKNNNLFSVYKLPFVKNLGLITYAESKNLMKESNFLILIDTYFPDAKNAMFLPSKLLDYALTGKEILSITNKNSTTFNFVENKFGSCFEHNDIENIKKFIRKRIVGMRSNHYYNTFESDKNFLDNYSAPHNAKKLAYLINNL